MTTSLVECLLNTHEYYECLENTQGDCDVDSDVDGGGGAPPRGTTWYPDTDVSIKPMQIFYV